MEHSTNVFGMTKKPTEITLSKISENLSISVIIIYRYFRKGLSKTE